MDKDHLDDIAYEHVVFSEKKISGWPMYHDVRREGIRSQPLNLGIDTRAREQFMSMKPEGK